MWFLPVQIFQFAFGKKVSCSYEIISFCIENFSLGDIEGINKNRKGKIKNFKKDVEEKHQEKCRRKTTGEIQENNWEEEEGKQQARRAEQIQATERKVYEELSFGPQKILLHVYAYFVCQLLGMELTQVCIRSTQ